MNNRFKIITPSFNNAQWVEYNMASLLNQTYTNFEVLYIDDASTDGTLDLVRDLVKDDKRFTLLRNEENKGAAYNYVEHVEEFVEDDDIIVHLDGDDWLIDETVLDKLNEYYNVHNCLMTYGQFVVWDGTDIKQSNPQGSPHSKFVHDHKLYRRDSWRASHLRTYKGSLFKAIDKEDMKDLKNGEYYWHAVDLAWAFPALEMCNESQIGVVDFYTHVYNQAPTNQVRTAERESVDNSHFENEVRNRKQYKEGLSGEKLPQVNVIGDFRERNSIPSTFSYVYNLNDGCFDITLVQDMDCIRYVNGEFNIATGKVVADIHEPPHLFEQRRVYDLVYENASKFDLILTYDDRLLKDLPNAVFRNGGGEVVLNKNVHKQDYPTLADDSLHKIYAKKDLVSFITSNKTFTEGHRFRVNCVNRLREARLPVDLFGVGYNEIVGKIDALHSYHYSIAIENGDFKNYFTEKILDCFLTGTIPIYKGCPNISDYFDPNGMIIFNNHDELVEIVAKLDKQDYYLRKESIEENFKRALQYKYNNDELFERYLKPLL